MSRILAYKCDKTGKLFEDASAYRSHVAKVAGRERAQRNEDRKERELAEFLSGVSECSSFEYIERWFVDNGERLLKKHYKDRGRRTLNPGDAVNSLDFYNMRWYSRLPWGGTNGWAGKLQLVMKSNLIFYSAIFQGTGIRVGSGSNGVYNVTLTANDFPALFVMEKLKGNLNE